MPLLQDNQDPEGLAARVAYHLHRLGISIKHLNQAHLTYEVARQLRLGSLQIRGPFIDQLCNALLLDANELVRPLNDDEVQEWRFYRVSARHATEVWRRVFESSTAQSLTQRELGKILEIPQSRINLLAAGKSNTPVLVWPQATRLAEALDLERGAEAFIGGLVEANPDRS